MQFTGLTYVWLNLCLYVEYYGQNFNYNTHHKI